VQVYTNKDTCSSLVYTGELFVFIASLPAVATPQDKIIEALEAEIIKLKTQLSDTEEKYQKMRKKFDDLMIKMHGGGRK